jgi:uncharacterized delta-60 repeat protein
MRRLLLFAFSLLLMQLAFSQAGQLDPSFGNGGSTAPIAADPSFGDMAIQPDGKIVAIGQAYTEPEGVYETYIVRFTTTGQLDKTFSGDGILNDPFLKGDEFSLGSITVQKDGKIVAVGRARYGRGFGVARYNPDGTPDKTFGNGGYVSTDPVPGSSGFNQAVSVAVTKDEKILVSGNHSIDNGEPPHATLVTYLPNGTVESVQVFYAGMSAEAYPTLAAYKSGGYALLAQGDKDVPYLYSSKFGQASVPLPNSYGPAPAKIAILENEKIAFAVYHRNESDEEGGYVALLNTDGTLDKSFSGDGVVNLPYFPAAVASQKDGKIIVSGGDANGVTKLERYSATGTLEFSFVTSGYVNDLIVYGNRIYGLTKNHVVAYLLDTRPRVVKVNLYGGVNPHLNGEWNNWDTYKSLNSGTLYYSDTTASSISAVLSSRSGVSDNGLNYGGGIAPTGVMRYASYATTTRTLTLSGLAASRKYTIQLFASRGAYSTDTTVFAVNGVSQKIGTYYNKTDKAVFTSLTPNAQGQIVVTISGTGTNNYLNGFTLTESYVPASTTTTSAQQAKVAVGENSTVEVNAFPNPTQQSFTLQLKGSTNKPVQVRVLDATGKLVEVKQNMASNTPLSLGAAYKAGVYYAEVIQGNTRKVVKLVKQ